MSLLFNKMLSRCVRLTKSLFVRVEMLLKDTLISVVSLSTVAGTAVSEMRLQFVFLVSQLQFGGHDDAVKNCNRRVAIIT
jgi:flagellar motor switch protein FliM